MDPAIIGVVALVLFAIAAVAAYFISMSSAAAEAERRLKQAESAYRASLRRLKDDPANAELREQTLYIGRAYSNLTRNKTGVTLYDEMALKNDLDAACAGASNRREPAESGSFTSHHYNSSEQLRFPTTRQLGGVDRDAIEALGLADDQDAASIQASQPSADVEITLRCNCGARITVSARIGGKTVKCPQCQGALRIPTLK